MPPLAANTVIKQYKVLAPIGKGGMGEVYLAQDTALGRKVALKILPSEFAADRDRMDRFVREAQSASALNHPNIITIYEIGESNGTHFIATEFIDGKTLTELAQSHALDYRVMLDVAIQVASALDDAHSAGIVHRDIKPDNVMVRSNGLTKVLDFGIAKLSAPTDSSDDTTTALQPQTHAGVLIGTPQFMSPEQVRGLRVDHQTDIFSLGVVMHHMLSGQSPFAGDTVSDALAAVLTREPRRLTEVPAALADIVSRTLQKDTRHRYRSAKDLLRDLRAFRQESDFQDNLDRRTESVRIEATPGRSGSRPSIAVLPFTNMSADADNEYFCDGLAEELLNALSKIDDLKVAARTSAFSFKGKSVNASEIGARLGVNHILEGSVRRSGNRLRISVQLVNASDGFHLWSNRYDSEMRDLFDVQDEIALAVVGALKVMLFGAEKTALLKRYTDDAAVHELFLKGRYYSNKYSAEGWTRAIEFFQRAIDMQPDHAPAHAAMAVCYGCLWYFGLLPAGQTVPQCKAATRKALDIDGTLADAHLPLAIITFFYDWEWERAEQAFKQSVALNSNNAEALSYYALFLAFEGRADEALARAQRALEIDPLSPLINMTVGWAYFSTGRSDAALDQVGKMIEIEPDFYGAYWLKGAIRMAEERYADAVEELKRAVSLGGHPIVVADLGSAYGLAARREDAVRILDQLLEMRRREYVPATCIARVYSRLGEIEKAIEWLETAFDERNGEMVFLQEEIAGTAEGDPLSRLGSDPRVKDLLRRMSLPQ
ncbi:MAG TPA: protein kinase [Vicinamibacterales bacterium]|nr:protein kinase [Vicinamibacterales bacterium]